MLDHAILFIFSLMNLLNRIPFHLAQRMKRKLLHCNELMTCSLAFQLKHCRDGSFQWEKPNVLIILWVNRWIRSILFFTFGVKCFLFSWKSLLEELMLLQKTSFDFKFHWKKSTIVNVSNLTVRMAFFGSITRLQFSK